MFFVIIAQNFFLSSLGIARGNCVPQYESLCSLNKCTNAVLSWKKTAARVDQSCFIAKTTVQPAQVTEFKTTKMILYNEKIYKCRLKC